MTGTFDTLRHIGMLEKEGNIDAALDMIYDAVDEMLRARQYHSVDIMLDTVAIEADAYGDDSLIGLLTVTLPARSHLSARERLYNSVEKTLQKRGTFTEDLLSGLSSSA